MKSDGTKKRQRIATVVVVLVVIAMVTQQSFQQ